MRAHRARPLSCSVSQRNEYKPWHEKDERVHLVHQKIIQSYLFLPLKNVVIKQKCTLLHRRPATILKNDVFPEKLQIFPCPSVSDARIYFLSPFYGM